MRYIIVGDVHGDLNQFLYPLMDYLANPLTQALIYLGDYFDRGISDVFIFEIINLILYLKQTPLHIIFDNIYFLRGNHECSTNSVYDFIGTANENEDGFLHSFVVSYAISSLNLPLFYYDRDHKILFSHSPISTIDLNVLLNSAYTTDDRLRLKLTTTQNYPPRQLLNAIPNTNYFNIHGHDHQASTDTDILNFFKCINGINTGITSISLDNDASHGFDLIKNSVSFKNTNSTDSFVKPSTKLFYIMFNTNSRFITDLAFIHNIIPLKSISNDLTNRNVDFNSKSLRYIINILTHAHQNMLNTFESLGYYTKTNINREHLINPWTKLNLNQSYKLLLEEFQKIQKARNIDKAIYIDKYIRHVFNHEYKEYINGFITHKYFHNIPSEIYNMLGMIRGNTYETPIEIFINTISKENQLAANVLRKMFGIED